MKFLLQIALGIIAAIGGFVDIGDLVFNSQAGATFGYSTLWAVPIGVVGIIVDLRKRVLKQGCGLFERDAVLEKVGRGLRGVPLERGSSH